ncbi:MAG TPA: tetratricopeptide repeat protein [Rhizomicrobium sp.]
MTALPLIGFAVVALAAIAFAAVPLWRRVKGKARALLLAAVALFMLAIGGGTYYLLGRPHLAVREAQGLNSREMNAMVPYLIKRVRENPNDPRAWRFLAQAYMSANDARDAAKALAREIAIAGKGDPVLDAAYGEALVLENGGAVPAEAEEAFNNALKIDPHSAPARFYLGLAKASRNDRPGALALWQSLLADIPTDAPLHQMLVDRIAMLTSQGLTQGPGGGAPNPRAMVDMLAARLKADPNDALGWVRLMKAYTVLGETEKAKQALADARKAFPDNKDAQTAFTTAAKALKIQ